MPNVNFTTENREALILKLQEIEDELSVHFQNLTTDERIRLLKIQDKSFAFVRKTIQYGKEFPMVIPPVLNIGQLEKDFTEAKEMDALIRKVEKLLECIVDARMIAADRTYSTSLKVYNAFRGASDLDVPGIKSAVDDLRKRFASQGTKRNDKPEKEDSTNPEKPVDNNKPTDNGKDVVD